MKNDEKAKLKARSEENKRETFSTDDDISPLELCTYKNKTTRFYDAQWTSHRITYIS